ncbi:MAG: ATP-binding protein [Marinilabilia sp.]
MHILDIAENSVRAGSTEVDVELLYSDDKLHLTIRDNGCGMDEEMVKKITDPYMTSRTTRKVGLGLPFLKMNAEQTGGSVSVESSPGKGTCVKAIFVTGHIDCVPGGDLAATLAALISGHPDVNFRIRIVRGESSFDISTAEIQEVLDGIPVSHPKVGVFIRNMLKEV